MALTTSAKYLGFWLIFFKCTQIIHAQCPPVGVIPQCECYDSGEWFDCHGLYSFGQLFLIASALYGNKLDKISFSNSKLRFWPSNIFSNIEIDRISLDECEILTFQEADFSQGLEGSCKELVATKTNLIENGEWKLNIRSLKTLTKLSMNKINIPELTQSLSYGLPEGLEDLGFLNCEIQELEGRFFTPLKNLKHLDFDENRITNLPEDINTLPLLETLDLWNNKILQLPENMMKIFPKLSYLNLHENEIEHLPENVWKDILEKVGDIFLTGNTLECDDGMKWIVAAKKPKSLFSGKCAKPKRIRGKKLSALIPDDFLPEFENV